jgi:hypothetical protein
MLPIVERCDTVIDEACGTSPPRSHRFRGEGGAPDRSDFFNRQRRLGSGEAAQQHGAFFERLAGTRQRVAVEKRGHSAVPEQLPFGKLL